MRLRNRAAILMFSKAMAQATVVVVGIILVRLLSRGQYGTYRQAMAFYAFLVAVLAAELEVYLLYLVPKNPVEARRPLLAQSLAAEMVVSGVIFAILLGSGQIVARYLNNPDLVPLFAILAFIPLFDRVLTLVQNFMIALDQAQWAAMYSLLNVVAKAVVTITVVAMGGHIEAVLIGQVVVGAGMAFPAFTHAMVVSRGGPFRLNPSLVREAFVYTYPLYLTGVAYTFVQQFDKLIASAFTDPATFALYSVGAISLPVVPIVVQSMTMATLPSLVKMAAAGRDAEALALWQEGMRKCSLVLFPCFAYFLVEGRDFIVLLYGRAYEAGAWVFRAYLALLPLQVAAFGAIFRAKGRTREIAVATGLGAVVSTGVGILLAWAGGRTVLGFIGPAIGVWAGMGTFVLILIVRLARMLGVDVKAVSAWKELGSTLALSLAASGPLWLLTLVEMPVVARLVVSAGVYASLLALVFWRMDALRGDEKALLASLMRACWFWRKRI